MTLCRPLSRHVSNKSQHLVPSPLCAVTCKPRVVRFPARTDNAGRRVVRATRHPGCTPAASSRFGPAVYGSRLTGALVAIINMQMLALYSFVVCCNCWRTEISCEANSTSLPVFPLSVNGTHIAGILLLSLESRCVCSCRF